MYLIQCSDKMTLEKYLNSLVEAIQRRQIKSQKKFSFLCCFDTLQHINNQFLTLRAAYLRQQQLQIYALILMIITSNKYYNRQTMEDADKNLKQAQGFIRYHLLSFNTSNKYEPLKQKIIESLDSNRQLAGLSQIQQYLNRYSYQTTKDLLCVKVFPALHDKKHEVYTCIDCAEEDNSTLCVQCFDISLHKGHKYELRQVLSGICDCGDKWKWKEDTFCKNHAYAPNQKQKRPEWVCEYKEFTAYLIKMLCWMYEAMLKNQNDKPNGLSQENKLNEDIKKFIDQMGSYIISQFILVNKNRIMNSQLFRQALHLEEVEFLNYPFSIKLQQNQLKGVSLMDMLLSFTYLPRTASKCVELLMILIFRSDQTLEQLTVEYLRRYTKSSSFARSNYHQLSPQLLSNSLMMSQIKDPLFIIQDYVDYNICDESQIGLKVEQAYQYVDRYLLDLSYIINLRKQCAQNYWNNFCQNRGFTKMANFSNIFNHERALDMVNQQYYQIQQRFLLKFIIIIDKHLSQKSRRMLVLQLFEMITNETNETNKMPKDYFFTYERMWALSVYLYLLRLTDDKSFNTIDSTQMIQLFRCLKIQDTKQSLLTLQSVLQKLLNRLFSYFIKIDTLLYHDNHDFYDDDVLSQVKDIYFDSLNILSSVDAIFFKILLRLSKYVEKKLQQKKQIVRGLVASEIDIYLSNLDKETKEAMKDKLNFLLKLKQLTYFISRMLECIYSDLPDLVLSCRFSDLHTRQEYRQAYRKYYLNLLKTVKENSRVPIEDFRKLANYYLFHETAVIQQVIDRFRSSENHLNTIECPGNIINFSFFHSLKLKADNQEAKQLLNTNKMNHNVFIQSPKEQHLIDDNSFISILQKWLDYIANNNQFFAEPDQDSQNSSLSDSSSITVSEMIKALWTIDRSSRNNSFHLYFSKNKFQKTIYIDRIQEYLKRQIIRYSYQNNYGSYLSSQNEQWSQEYRNYLKEQKQSINAQLLPEYLQESISSRQEQPLSTVGNIVIELKPPICLNCKQGASINESLFQLCYISQNKVPSFYDLYPDQTSLYYSSCTHFVHQSCISQYQENICQQCGKRYNCLLFIEQNLNITNYPDYLISQIEQSFKKLQKCLSLSGPCVEVKLFNSILMFLMLLVSVPDHQLLLRAEILTFRNIFHVLKKYLSREENYRTIYNARKDMLKSNLKGCYQNFINSVSQLLTSQLLNEKTDLKDNYFHGKQLILQFFDNMNKSQLTFSNICNSSTQQTFSLRPLQPNLFELQQSNTGLCKCQEHQQSNVFYVCLLHKDEVKFCRRCYQKEMRQHIIQCHQNEAISVRTDTGEVIYFRNDGGMKQVRIAAIYTNKLMQGYAPGKDNNKIQYTLNQTIYKQIATRYISKMFNI